MAEGGTVELDDESIQETDFFYEFPCSPCEKDGSNVEAIKYCVDCDENLCTTCLIHHNKFAMMQGHKLLNQIKTNQGQTKKLPSQRCSKHGGKIIDVFCPEHDTVGCSTCISVEHSSCKGKEFIPDVAAGIKTSQEIKQLENEMKTLIFKLDSLKKKKGDNVQRLKRDKGVLKKEIQSVRKKMNEQLDRMEKELLNEAETNFKQKIDANYASIAEVDDMLARLKQAMDQMKDDNSDADIFVSCKVVKREMNEEIYPLHENINDEDPHHSLELHLHENTEQILEGNFRNFASIKDKYTIHGADYKEEINIRVSDDKKICTVACMCALSDGCIVMSDFNNKKLKKMDPVSNNVSTLISLPDCPFGLCLVDNTRLAVALFHRKQIQFVALSGKVKLDTSFSVGDGCRDLANCDGLLYVCCGGSAKPEHKEGRGHVEVYKSTGELLRCFYEEFGCPEYINVINDGYNTTMYISDTHKGVQVRTIDGAVKYRFPTDLNIVLPFCLIGTDRLCIGERSTGNIYIQTYKDTDILVQKTDVKGKLKCLYFEMRSSRLFVALKDCDVIKVLKFKFK